MHFQSKESKYNLTKGKDYKYSPLNFRNMGQ